MIRPCLPSLATLLAILALIQGCGGSSSALANGVTTPPGGGSGTPTPAADPVLATQIAATATIAPGPLVADPVRDRIYFADSDGQRILIINTLTDLVIGSFTVGTAINDLAISADGARLAVAGDGLTMIDLTSDAVTFHAPPVSPIRSVAFDAAGDVVVASPDGPDGYTSALDRFDVIAQSFDPFPALVFGGIDGPFGPLLRSTTDGRTLFMVERDIGSTAIWRIDTTDLPYLIENIGLGSDIGLNHLVTDLAVAPAGDQLYVAAATDSMAIDPITLLSTAKLVSGRPFNDIVSVAANPDGASISVGLGIDETFAQLPISSFGSNLRSGLLPAPATGILPGLAQAHAGAIAVSRRNDKAYLVVGDVSSDQGRTQVVEVVPLTTGLAKIQAPRANQ